MHTNLKLQADISQFVIIDKQTRLIAVMPQDSVKDTIKNTCILSQAANLLKVPVIITEQYPKGLGNTFSEILDININTQAVVKTVFSCVEEPKFNRQLTVDHSQIVLVGMEAHICVLQTALDLISAGKKVFVAEDAIISRNSANKVNAIARMRDSGCIICNTESIIFEWLGKAEGDAFKSISKLIR